MDLKSLIRNRRSIRKFKENAVEKEKIIEILDAGRWAPSGLNNQPWRFYVVQDKTQKENLAKHTKYSHIIHNADTCICVFLDSESSYDRTKDLLAIGACIENMLLTAEELGLASCWLGEILNQKEKVNELLKIGKRYELMAVIALGYGNENPKSQRKKIEEMMLQ